MTHVVKPDPPHGYAIKDTPWERKHLDVVNEWLASANFECIAACRAWQEGEEQIKVANVSFGESR